MSKCFIEGIGCSGGGSAKLPAIYVQYPAGSICTCTNGEKTYTAKDTTGYWLFAGLSIGTWTVTITDPTGENEPVSETVEITTEGQSVSLELSYSLYLYKNGDEYTDITGGWQSERILLNSSGNAILEGAVTKENTYISLYAPTDKQASIVTGEKIDLSKHRSLTLDQTRANLETGYMNSGKIHLLSSQLDIDSSVEYAVINETGQTDLSLDGINGEYYVAVCTAGYYETNYLDITEIFLD